MGKHYIPKYYLKGFSTPENENRIVTYQVNPEKFFTTNLINIGQETNFYSDEKEKYLAEEIEEPANEVLRKIKQRKKLTYEDKEIFSSYLLAILKRVPSFINFIKSKLPDAIEETKQKAEDRYKQFLKLNQIDEKDAKEIFLAIENFDALNNFNEEITKEIWLDFINPEKTPLVLNEIKLKKWVFFINKTDQYLITSDNPFYFDKQIGLRNSEFSFPITKDIALVAVDSENLLPNYANPRRQIIKELNRRTIANSHNYVYSPKEEDWIITIIRKRGNIILSRININ